MGFRPERGGSYSDKSIVETKARQDQMLGFVWHFMAWLTSLPTLTFLSYVTWAVQVPSLSSKAIVRTATLLRRLLPNTCPLLGSPRRA